MCVTPLALYPLRSASWSSVRMKRMLGRPVVGAGGSGVGLGAGDGAGDGGDGMV